MRHRFTRTSIRIIVLYSKADKQAVRSLGVTTGAVLFSVAVPIAGTLYFGGPWVSEVIEAKFGVPLMLLALGILADFQGKPFRTTLSLVSSTFRRSG